MKKILLVISTFLCFGIAVAQTNSLDNQLKNVNQAAVTSGIIYDRATPLADLTIFNIPAEKPLLARASRSCQQIPLARFIQNRVLDST